MTTLFKLAAPSISSCALSIYFSQFLPLLLFSSYPLPTLTMDHIPLSKCDGLWTFVYPPYIHNMRWRPRFCTGWSDPDNSARSLVTIAIQHRSVDPSIDGEVGLSVLVVILAIKSRYTGKANMLFPTELTGGVIKPVHFHIELRHRVSQMAILLR